MIHPAPPRPAELRFPGPAILRQTPAWWYPGASRSFFVRGHPCGATPHIAGHF